MKSESDAFPHRQSATDKRKRNERKSGGGGGGAECVSVCPASNKTVRAI